MQASSQQNRKAENSGTREQDSKCQTSATFTFLRQDGGRQGYSGRNRMEEGRGSLMVGPKIPQESPPEEQE